MATREHQGTHKGGQGKQRGGQHGRLKPVQLQKHLGGLDYPVSKEDLIERAQEEGADEEMMNLLGQLPDREYNSPVAVSKEAARIMKGEGEGGKGGRENRREGRNDTR
jgi:hypothetical protein